MTIVNRNTWSKPTVLSLLLTTIWGIGTEHAAAQTLYGGLVGNVRDASEGVVAGATVTITNVNTNQSRQAVTNEVGSYSIPTVDAGTYTVRVTKEGFSTASRATWPCPSTP